MKDPKNYPHIYGTIETINNYVKHRIAPGGFVRAVLENDLKNSFGRADENNQRHLFDIVKYCYNEIPMNCWGSPEEVENWLNQ